MAKKKKEVKALPAPKPERRILFKNSQSPGDILMLSAAVRDLKLSHPEIEIGVSTSCGEIWENNPHIVEMDEKKDKDIKFNIVDNFLKIQASLKQHYKTKEKLKSCKECGEPARGDICKTCELIKLVRRDK